MAKALEVSEQTFHRWRAQYGGMKADAAKELRELGRENASLKRIVADKELENVAAEGDSGAWHGGSGPRRASWRRSDRQINRPSLAVDR